MSGPWEDLTRPPLRVTDLRRGLLPPSGPFARVDVLPSTPSTNASVAAAVAQDPSSWPDLSVLTTDDQTAGRGRLGRTWVTPPRTALAVSVLLRPPTPAATWSWLPLLAGLAVVDALRRVAGVDAGLKWPNDVLVQCTNGRRPEQEPAKVCGVLAEVLPGDAVVVGVGLNVLQRQEELPVPTATSLVLEGAATTDRDTVLRAVLRSFAERYAVFCDHEGDAVAAGLAAAVREACWTLGRTVEVGMPGAVSDTGPLRGVAEEMDDEGRLVVRDAEGVVHAVAAGDVVHVRVRA